MRRLKILIIIPALFILMNVRISVEGVEDDRKAAYTDSSRSKYELEAVVRGAVEDRTWMFSKSKQEVYAALGRYFEGALLEDLARESWDFIAEPTDWYSRARLLNMSMLYIDNERAVVEALIGIEDVDTGHNETGKGLFTMSKTVKGWRINYLSLVWDGQ
ncbi:MAG: hypothetical protein K6T65_08020 [Peptococcaceae bacterium]|nr:hypothetical protein [Peptococcaceae bacterium]